tara:strand:- start:901 stop:1077 length:177 start_codon:yes stop_codon:yes gene_type:complete
MMPIIAQQYRMLVDYVGSRLGFGQASNEGKIVFDSGRMCGFDALYILFSDAPQCQMER